MLSNIRLAAELVGYSLLSIAPNFPIHSLGGNGLTISLSYPDTYKELHKPLKTHLLEVLLRSPAKTSISLTARLHVGAIHFNIPPDLGWISSVFRLIP
jgi:hypothetical protein